MSLTIEPKLNTLLYLNCFLVKSRETGIPEAIAKGIDTRMNMMLLKGSRSCALGGVNVNLFDYDRSYHLKGHESLAGVDEAGRGPLAGPVVAAAVILDYNIPIEGIDDSKKLTPKQREKLFSLISKSAKSIGIEIVDQETIDKINILKATHLAMKCAVANLSATPSAVLVDGLPVASISGKQFAIIGGDGKSACIAAASIIAKVTRDRIMCEMSQKYPGYGFEKHKGYGTKLHIEALSKLGPCLLHRKTFFPVSSYFEPANA
jgi:ribonuclease HII